jgi:type I restriction enzyme M protein
VVHEDSIKIGGQFDTPRCAVRVPVEILASPEQRVYDPCRGSAGMFVQSKINAVECDNNARLFGGETEPSLVA